MTTPRHLDRLAAEHPRAIATLEKRHGIWHPVAWADHAVHVREAASGLATLGVGRGDAIAVIADNRPAWRIAELAAHCLGAAVVGVDPASADDVVVRALEAAAVRVAVVDDEAQVDQLARVAARLAAPLRVVSWSARAEPPAARLTAWSDLVVAGRRDAAARPGWLDGEIAAGRADEIAVVCAAAAPGDTGDDAAGPAPGLARLTHRDLFALAAQLHRLEPPRDRRPVAQVAAMPLAWIGEQMSSVAYALAHGTTVAFPEDAATTHADLREIGPDLLLGPPRLWEHLRTHVQHRIADAGWLGRRILDWALGVGAAIAEHRARGTSPGTALRAAHRVAEAIALGAVRDRLGLARTRRGYATGAPPPEVARFFHAIGIELVAVEAAAR
jgi:long-chain acyl-CoA synthetase